MNIPVPHLPGIIAAMFNIEETRQFSPGCCGCNWRILSKSQAHFRKAQSIQPDVQCLTYLCANSHVCVGFTSVVVGQLHSQISPDSAAKPVAMINRQDVLETLSLISEQIAFRYSRFYTLRV